MFHVPWFFLQIIYCIRGKRSYVTRLGFQEGSVPGAVDALDDELGLLVALLAERALLQAVALPARGVVVEPRRVQPCEYQAVN